MVAWCTDKQFRCDSGHCIPRSKRCDGKLSCRNGEDEKDCNEGKVEIKHAWNKNTKKHYSDLLKTWLYLIELCMINSKQNFYPHFFLFGRIKISMRYSKGKNKLKIYVSMFR